MVMDRLALPWRLLSDAAGTCVVYAQGDLVLKLFKTPQSVARQYGAWGLDLGTMPGAGVPGDTLLSAAAHVALALEGCAYAWEHLREEAALVHVHLSASAGVNASLPGGCRDLGNTPFVLQRRVDLFGDRLSRTLQRGEEDAALELLTQWLDYVETLWERGLTGNGNFDENYGFLDSRFVLVDTGDVRVGRHHVAASRRSAFWLWGPAYRRLAQRSPVVADRFTAIARERLATAPARQRTSRTTTAS